MPRLIVLLKSGQRVAMPVEDPAETVANIQRLPVDPNGDGRQFLWGDGFMIGLNEIAAIYPAAWEANPTPGGNP
jgi:hypothetical protein